MCKECVCKGKHAIYPIFWGTTVSTMERKCLIARGNHLAKQGEISIGCVSFQSSEFVERYCLQGVFPICIYQADHFGKISFVLDQIGVIPPEPVQYLSRVEYFTSYEDSTQCQRFLFVVGDAVLRTTKQHISIYLTYHPLPGNTLLE